MFFVWHVSASSIIMALKISNDKESLSCRHCIVWKCKFGLNPNPNSKMMLKPIPLLFAYYCFVPLKRVPPLQDASGTLTLGVRLLISPNFLRSVIFPLLQNCGTNGCPLNATFMFERWARSWAAVTPVNYERDWKNLRATFSEWNISPTEKLTNGALVTTPA